MTARESRPSERAEAASAFGGATSGYPSRPAVRGRLRVDLRTDLRCDEHRAGRRIQEAAHAPVGASVVFVVGRGHWPPPMACSYFATYGTRVGSVTVESDDPATITQWLRALTTEAPRAIA